MEREQHIQDCGRLMLAAYDRFEQTHDFADLGESHRWRLAMEEAIKTRDDQVVRDLEIARGLA